MGKAMKTGLGAVLGTTGYFIGFFVIAPLMYLITTFGIIPPFVVDLWLSRLTITAFCANGLAGYVFEKFNKKPAAQIGFAVWLIVLAVAYGTTAILAQTVSLLWYTVVSILWNVVVIATAIKELSKKEECRPQESSFEKARADDDYVCATFLMRAEQDRKAREEAELQEACRRALDACVEAGVEPPVESAPGLPPNWNGDAETYIKWLVSRDNENK